jgi:hypothetical protein
MVLGVLKILCRATDRWPLHLYLLDWADSGKGIVEAALRDADACLQLFAGRFFVRHAQSSVIGLDHFIEYRCRFLVQTRILPQNGGNLSESTDAGMWD